MSCAKIARESVKKNMRGLEFLIGIPGTIGGALKMNAGANGNDTWQSIKSVDVISREGKYKSLKGALLILAIVKLMGKINGSSKHLSN